MAEDPRRSAEIRRMASQKVAAELIKELPFKVGEDLDAGFSHYLDIVDLIDKDVVEAGDRAETQKHFPGSYGGEDPPPTPDPPNGSEAATEDAEGLSETATARMIALLGKVDPELLKLQLWQLQLPQTTIPEVVAVMTKPQAKALVPWLKENAKDKDYEPEHM